MWHAPAASRSNRILLMKHLLFGTATPLILYLCGRFHHKYVITVEYQADGSCGNTKNVDSDNVYLYTLLLFLFAGSFSGEIKTPYLLFVIFSIQLWFFFLFFYPFIPNYLQFYPVYGTSYSQMRVFYVFMREYASSFQYPSTCECDEKQFIVWHETVSVSDPSFI